MLITRRQRSPKADVALQCRSMTQPLLLANLVRLVECERRRLWRSSAHKCDPCKALGLDLGFWGFGRGRGCRLGRGLGLRMLGWLAGSFDTHLIDYQAGKQLMLFRLHYITLQYITLQYIT